MVTLLENVILPRLGKAIPGALWRYSRLSRSTWHPIFAKVGNNIADKRRSQGRNSSLADSDYGFFLFLGEAILWPHGCLSVGRRSVTLIAAALPAGLSETSSDGSLDNSSIITFYVIYLGVWKSGLPAFQSFDFIYWTSKNNRQDNEPFRSFSFVFLCLNFWYKRRIREVTAKT
jgi:hypothetical protein